jgi:hypothetical protein
VTKGYIILAALKLLGLSSLDQFESIKNSTEKEDPVEKNHETGPEII